MAAEENPHPDKLGYNGEWRPATEGNVILNGYQLNIDEMVDEVHKFELKFTAENKRNQVKDLSAGPRNDVSRELRHNLAWELYEKMLETNANWFQIAGKPDLFGYVYDRGINFYSVKKLPLEIKKGPNDPAQNKIEFPLSKEGLSPASTAYLIRMDNIKASLVYTEIVNLRAFRQDRLVNRSVAQFLDILSNQQILKTRGYYMFPSKMFEKSSNITLQHIPHIMKQGMQKNVRFVGENLRNSTPIIQIDAKKSAFFPERQHLSDFAADFLNIGQPVEIWQHDNLNRLRKQVKGVVCMTTHLGEKNTTVAITNLTDEPANQKTFQWQDRGEVTVEHYFRQHYNINLRFPQLPCVIERKPQNRESYFPLEVLEIVPGQRVSIQQQTPRLTEQMIRNCQALPADFRGNTNRQKENAAILNSNLYFRKFRVKVDNDLLNANAKLLFPPCITYNRDEQTRVEPNNRGDYDNGWSLRPNDGRKFISPMEQMGPKDWAAIIVASGVSGNECMTFLTAFVNQARNRGLQLQLTGITENAHNTYPSTMNQIAESLQKSKTRFCLFFTRDKNDPAPHMAFKFMEAKTGIITQHVTAPIMQKAIGQKGAIMVLDNLLMKFNAKNGGFAHGIRSGQIFLNTHRRGQSDDVLVREFFSKERMFIGFEMSHAAPQSLYERQAGIAVGDPSITGMAYTIGVGQNILDMRGTYWCQESRVTSIKYLQHPLEGALMKFRQKNGRFPRHLIVYRGGVSEGEFLKVATEEREQFEATFEKLQSDEPEFAAPALTIIVCQRQSNYRIVPQNVNPRDRAPQQNVPRGTVVDGSVMHPTLTEFLMVGHTTIQGTGQPVRCTVVYDNSPEKRIERIGLAELEYLTYTLCYAHGIVTLPVSVPAVLYGAGDLAKRGRANYKALEEREQGNANFGRKGEGQTDDVYFSNISALIGPRIDTKFWA